MPSTHEVAYAIFGAYRLAVLDRTGMAYFDQSAGGALRSFHAALIVLPAYILLVLIRQADVLAEVSPLRFLVVEAIAYVISWTAFAVLMMDLSRLLDRADRYFGFLCVYNWSAVIQVSVYLPVLVIAELGLLPGEVAELAVFLITAAILVYQWFIIRVALNLPPISAAGLVFIDMILSIVIFGTADNML